ncbi:hypothetical protein C8R47DRAFT_1200657 [Mycena vitilis]|nr:hypothetical protein C8R47DRAFT_1200657 [Mycena vitilis]
MAFSGVWIRRKRSPARSRNNQCSGSRTDTSSHGYSLRTLSRSSPNRMDQFPSVGNFAGVAGLKWTGGTHLRDTFTPASHGGHGWPQRCSSGRVQVSLLPPDALSQLMDLIKSRRESIRPIYRSLHGSQVRVLRPIFHWRWRASAISAVAKEHLAAGILSSNCRVNNAAEFGGSFYTDAGAGEALQAADRAFGEPFSFWRLRATQTLWP